MARNLIQRAKARLKRQKRATSQMPADARIGDGYGGGRRTLSPEEADRRVHEALGLPPPEFMPGGGVWR